MTTPRAVYLDVQPDPLFAIVHDAAVDDGVAPPRATGVLIVPPFGWNDVASYRSRRDWAAQLAGQGFIAMYVDLPGTGDSGGEAADPARVDAWAAAVDAATRWLQAQAGIERIAVIGLAMGGLVAVRAAANGAPIDDLVLWATPADGRQMVRQERAFAAMQASRFSLTGEAEPRVIPEDWLEVNGFVLSAETIGDLGTIDLATSSYGRIGRALLLDADGVPINERVYTHLVASGVATDRRSGRGWGAMISHPERTEVPVETMRTVADWLAAAATDGVRHPPSGQQATAPAVHSAATLATAHGLLRETPVWVRVGDQLRFGVLAEPVSPDGDDVRSGPPLAAMFLNAGAVRRIGPDRLWVETARRWAARGVPSLRLDLEGIGDSDGDGTVYREVARFYDHDRLMVDIHAGIDLLAARGLGPHIVLVGLCAGGYHAANGALADPRVTAAMLLNPGALTWDHGLVHRRDARKVRRLLEPAWWSRLLRGEVSLGRMAAVGRAVVHSSIPFNAQSGAHTTATALLDGLRDRDVSVDLAFSSDEALESELETDGTLGQMALRWPNVLRHRLPGRDHTLRPLIAQSGAHALLDAALEREIARRLPRPVPATSSLGAPALDAEAVR